MSRPSYSENHEAGLRESRHTKNKMKSRILSPCDKKTILNGIAFGTRELRSEVICVDIGAWALDCSELSIFRLSLTF